MGDVAVVMRVMPDDADTDLATIKEAIRDAVDVTDMGEEEVAFGLKAITFSTIVKDQKGGTDELEEAVNGIDGVRSAEITDMNRL